MSLAASVDDCLKRFRAVAERRPGPAPWSVRIEGTGHDKHVLFGGITHGNEIGSLPSLVSLAEGLDNSSIEFGGTVTIMLGNVEACLADERFLEADLNRVFLSDAPESKEKDRAHELMPLFKDVDLFIDYHQTIEPSEKPFFIFPFHLDGYHWARVAGGGLGLITRDPKKGFARGQVCADEYARNLGVPAITLEMGQKGFTSIADQLTKACCSKVLNAMDEVAGGASLEVLANKERGSELEFFEIQFAQGFDSEFMALHAGMKNFTRVQAGQIIGRADRAGNPLKAPMDGHLLFPKYPLRSEDGEAERPFPSEIYNLAIAMNGHPMDIYD